MTTTTDNNGKFNEKFAMPNVTTKKDYGVQAVYDGSLKNLNRLKVIQNILLLYHHHHLNHQRLV